MRNNAANVHNASDWNVIFSLVEIVGAGAAPADPPKTSSSATAAAAAAPPTRNEGHGDNDSGHGASSDSESEAATSSRPASPDRSNHSVRYDRYYCFRTLSPLAYFSSKTGPYSYA